MQRYGFNTFVYMRMNMWVKTKTETTYLHHPVSDIRIIRFSRNSSDSLNFPNPPPSSPLKATEWGRNADKWVLETKTCTQSEGRYEYAPLQQPVFFSLVCRTAFYTDLSFFSRRVIDTRVQTDPAVYTYFNGTLMLHRPSMKFALTYQKENEYC